MDHLVNILLVALVGGLLAVDRSAAFQLMASRPIVAGPIIGLILGRPDIGVILGGLVELIWIGRLPLGGYVPPNETVGTVVGAAAVILAADAWAASDRSLIALGFLFVPPVAHLAAFLEGRQRRFNTGLAKKAASAVTAGQPNRIYALHMSGLAVFFLGATVYTFVCLALVSYLLAVLSPVMPPTLIAALEILYITVPLVGLAAALSNLNVKRSDVAFALLFCGAFVVLSL